MFFNRRNGFRIFIGVFTGAGRSGGFAFSGGTDGAGAKKFLNNFKKRFFPVFSHREMPDILINFAPEMKFRFRARFRNLRRDARVVADRRYGGIFSQFVFGNDAFWGGRVAHSVLILAVVISLGVALGKIKIAGVRLGVTWILFVGITFSHFGMQAQRAPVTLPERIRIDPVRLFDRAAGGAEFLFLV